MCRDLSLVTVQVGKPAEEDLRNWGHHTSVNSVPDPVMQAVGQQHVTFIFSCQVGPYLPLTCISAKACTADRLQSCLSAEAALCLCLFAACWEQVPVDLQL